MREEALRDEWFQHEPVRSSCAGRIAPAQTVSDDEDDVAPSSLRPTSGLVVFLIIVNSRHKLIPDLITAPRRNELKKREFVHTKG